MYFICLIHMFEVFASVLSFIKLKISIVVTFNKIYLWQAHIPFLKVFLLLIYILLVIIKVTLE